MAVKILIADDSPMVRRAIRRVIEYNPEWKVCGEALDGQQAVELARRLSPDLIVLDLSMPHLNGLEAAQIITALQPETRVLLCTLNWTKELTEEAQLAGISGAVSKCDGLTKNLINGISALLRQESYFPAA